jgi:diguanylate cyclase (GGDEF)-like protein
VSTPTNRRILIIDDTPSIHEDFRWILDRAGCGFERHPGTRASATPLVDAVPEPASACSFHLQSAHQGREGVELVRASLQNDRPFAIAFVDLRMPPGWDGVETILEIWKVDPRIEIVICTEQSDHTWDPELGGLGEEDRLLVMKKPMDNVVVAQLASVLTAKWDITHQAHERTAALEMANQEMVASVEEFTHLANHDALTGLPNRLLFADRAAQTLAVAQRDGTRPAVLMLDVDRFRVINETLGHHHGDLLLTQLAQRLAIVLRPGDTAARFGGDAFAMLLSDGGSEAGSVVARRIAEALEVPFQLGDSSVGIEASIGIATQGIDEQPTMAELLRQADIAMFKAKTDRCGFAHYSATNDDATEDRLALIGELRQAIDRDELVVYYQPQVAVDTGQLLGVEALVRWAHPTRGLLLPVEFIVLAEGSTLIQGLTLVVLDSALHCCRTWLDEGVRLPVAVNVSARSLCDPLFPVTVKDRLAHAGVPAPLLTLELTEGVLAHSGVARVLQKLRDLGVRVSVDDYGTGYSSMAYLRNLPVTELKIDQAFIKDVAVDAKDAVMVQSATELGHNLGLSVVAEGVEDEVTLNSLRSLGVDVAQGYHVGHPMPEDGLRRWIEERAFPLTRNEPSC